MTDPLYIKEQDREIALGFPKCRCSHCDTAGCELLLKYMRRLTIDNFEDALKDPRLLEDLPGYQDEDLNDHARLKKKIEGSCT